MKYSLYFKPSCPYCLKVINFIEEKKIKVELINVNIDIKEKQRLVEEGTLMQVPCLRIDNDNPNIKSDWMYESEDIMQYIERYNDQQ